MADPYRPPVTSEPAAPQPEVPALHPGMLLELRGMLVAWVAIWLFDVTVMGQGVLAVLATLVLLAVAIVRGIRRHNRPALLALRVAIALSLAPAALGAIALNNLHARHQARRIIAAFTHDRGRFEELAPRYLRSIPLAKYALTFGRFRYDSLDGRHSPMWTEPPPSAVPTTCSRSGAGATWTDRSPAGPGRSVS